MYWVVGRHADSGIARELRLGEHSVWSSPLCWRGNTHVGGSELRAMPESRVKQERVSEESGEGFWWTPSQKILKNHTWNQVEAEIYLFPVADPGISRRWAWSRFRSQPNSCVNSIQFKFNSIQFRYLHAPTYKLSRWRARRTQKTWSPGGGLQEKKWVFNLILKLFSERPGSRRCTGSAFQAADDAK